MFVIAEKGITPVSTSLKGTWKVADEGCPKWGPNPWLVVVQS
jgi:hypothetical protein